MPLREAWVVKVWIPLGRVGLGLCRHSFALVLISATFLKPIVRLGLMEALNLRWGKSGLGILGLFATKLRVGSFYIANRVIDM